MSNGMLIGVALIMTAIASVAIALYIAGRQNMRQRTLDERPIIVADPSPIRSITDVQVIMPPPVQPEENPA